LILRKIIKIVATRCHILKLKCTKFDFSAHSAPPGLLAGLRGPTSKGRGGKGTGKEKEKRKRKGKKVGTPHFLDESYAPDNALWVILLCFSLID